MHIIGFSVVRYLILDISLIGLLTCHIRIHTREKPYKCNQCNRHFSQQIIPKNHIRAHTGGKPIICTPFNKTFPSEKNTFSGDSLCLCRQCNRAFLYDSTLLAYITIHTGEKPFKCNQGDMASQEMVTTNTNIVIKLIH